MKILVTGGAGYIGSHTCKALARAGHTPVVYDDLSTGHASFVKWGPLVKGDIRDGARLFDAMVEHDVDSVVHFAALADVAESVRAPELYWDVNVAGTLTLLKEMAAAKVRRLVFSSTCATYGEPERVPIDERHVQKPVNPYGQSKLAMERMISDFADAYDMRYVALRYFNACGADPEGEIGEDHEPESHVVPRAILAAMGLSTFSIMGTDYDTPDGTALRDYVHVSDLADAHVLSLEHLSAGGANHALNLGTGVALSVRDIVDAVSKVVGKPLDFTERERREGDPARLVADAGLAREVLGFVPRRSDVSTIVADAYAWHTKNVK